MDTESEGVITIEKLKFQEKNEKNRNSQSHLTTTPRYSLRARKRPGNDDEEERQAKRIKAMLAFLNDQQHGISEDNNSEFALAAMKQPLVYGKIGRKGIFERLYALFVEFQIAMKTMHYRPRKSRE